MTAKPLRVAPAAALLAGILLAAPGALGPSRARAAARPEYFAASGLFFPVTGQADYCAVGDFNEDGHADEVVSCEAPDHLAFLAGDGHGQLLPEVVTPLSARAGNIRAADMNGDGHLDLVAADFQANVVSVLLGHGAGTFDAPLSITLPGAVRNFALGDLDGLNGPDVAAVVAGVNKVATLVSGPGGALTLAGLVNPGGTPWGIDIGELNGDGHADVVVTTWTPHGIAWFAGVGDGTLAGLTTLSGGSYPQFVRAADVNDDKKADLLYDYNSSGAGLPTQLAVQLSNGDGTFQPRILNAGISAVGPAITDLDGDGHVDVLAGWSDAWGDFTSTFEWRCVGLGDGAGHFATAVHPSSGKPWGNWLLADMDEDGRLDLAGRACVVRGHGDGTFGVVHDLSAPRNVGTVSLGDLNGDGRPDISAAGGNCEYFGQAGLDARLVGAGGVPGAAWSQVNGALRCARGSAPLDFNADGRLDLAISVQGASGLVLLPGNGDGTYGSSTLLVGPCMLDVASADLNGDSRPDLVGVGCSNVSVFVALPGGGFAPRVDYTLPGFPYAIEVAVARMNGDAWPDLVIVGNDSPGQLFVLPGQAGGVFGAATSYGVPDYASGLALADFNGDGRLDVAVAADPPTLLLGQPGGTLGGSVALPAPFGLVSWVGAADVDHDGHPDLLSIAGDDVIGLQLGHGDGMFEANLGYGLDGWATDCALGDLNGDGLLDLVSANTGPSTLTRLMGVSGVSDVITDTARGTAVGRLLSATPNPMTAGTSIAFELAEPAAGVRLGLFDIRGRLVRRWETPGLPAGRHTLEWDGRADTGVPVPAGAYFARLLNVAGGPTLKVMRMR